MVVPRRVRVRCSPAGRPTVRQISFRHAALHMVDSEFHRHRFDNVTGYLHHRDPYLLIDRVVSIQDDLATTTKTLRGDEFFLTGHFPGAAVLPGAMMQEATTQTAGVLIAANYNPMAVYDTEDPEFNEYALGVLVRIKSARYRHFARPGETITVTARLDTRVDRVFDFVGRVEVDGRTILRNEFQLTNIPSSTLRGSE